MKKKIASSCEMCVNYVYNEEDEFYECEVNLDEDEMYNFLKSSCNDCPHFRLEDEYGIVRKQI